MSPNSGLFSHTLVFGMISTVSHVAFQNKSHMSTIRRIPTPGLLSFGQFLKKKKKQKTKKATQKGQNELQGFWFSTYFFGYL